MSTLSEDERQELSLLLPWYANGTLEEEDRRRVEAALAEDDALAREFDLVLEDQAAMIALVSEEEVPVSIGERFKAALNAEQDAAAAPAAPAPRGESMISRLVGTLFPARQQAIAALAVVMILLLPALVILSGKTGNEQKGPYQTATGEDETGIETTRVLVKFRAGAAWAEIDAFLKENRGQVVKGPSADSLYELQFETNDTLADRIGAANGIFEFALPSD